MCIRTFYNIIAISHSIHTTRWTCSISFNRSAVESQLVVFIDVMLGTYRRPYLKPKVGKTFAAAPSREATLCEPNPSFGKSSRPRAPGAYLMRARLRRHYHTLNLESAREPYWHWPHRYISFVTISKARIPVLVFQCGVRLFCSSDAPTRARCRRACTICELAWAAPGRWACSPSYGLARPGRRRHDGCTFLVARRAWRIASAAYLYTRTAHFFQEPATKIMCSIRIKRRVRRGNGRRNEAVLG